MNVLILTTDAGGGHRSVAKALAAGFQAVGGATCNVHVVDFIAGYAPFPLSRARQVYTFLMRYPFLWSMFYTTTNTSHGRAFNAPAVGLAMEAGMSRLLREHTPDVVVATHPMGAPALTALLHRRGQSLPYYTVVTDYGGLHTWWAYPFGELWFAPSEETGEHLVRSGIPAERVVVSGYPVHPRFARRTRTAAEIRQALGLEPDRFTALLVGGAEGVGPLAEIVEALASAPAPWQLIAVTGRNRALKEHLDSRAADWAIPVRVEGSVDDMPTRMHAADVLLTKAGGSTLSEGLTCGLPMLLISVLPGQEEENAHYFQGLGVARQALSPAEARAALVGLAAPASARLQQMRSCAQRAARPFASLEIARHVLNRGKTATVAPISPLYGLHLLRLHAMRGRATMPWRSWLR